MEYLFFVAYLILFAWLVTRVNFFLRTGLSKYQLIILFLLKVVAGIFYGWIGIYYGGMAQMYGTWGYHSASIQEYHLLFNNPHEYLTNLFHNPYTNGISKFFDTNDSYWNDLKGNIFIKILSVFNIFSFGNYYINVIFYSFITLAGPIAIYRIMSAIFTGKKNILFLSVFLVPSFLYWTSGINKEGLIFTGISLVAYSAYFGSIEKRLGFKRITGLITGILLVLVLRNSIIIILIPAIITLLLANRRPKYGFSVFASLYLLYGILFFTLRYIDPRLDFPQAVVNKQIEFVGLKGGITSVPIKQLEPTAISFLKNTPQAITLSAIRPYPKDVHHLLSMAAAIEINILLLMFVLFIFWRTSMPVVSKNFIYFCIFFSFTLLLSIGFSVNNLGAIVRYRSVIIPLLVPLIATYTDWARINNLFYIKINNNI